MRILFSDGVKSIVDKQVDEELSWMAWRSLVVEGVHENTTFVLAQERTLRKDVFNHFKRYTGGWNISNPEYISVTLLLFPCYSSSTYIHYYVIWTHKIKLDTNTTPFIVHRV